MHLPRPRTSSGIITLSPGKRPAGRGADARNRSRSPIRAGILGFLADVDGPVGELGREADVLGFLPDRQGGLPVGHDGAGQALVPVEDVDPEDLGGGQGRGDELRRLVVIVDDVDLLSAELHGDGADALAVVADAGADIVDINMGCPVKKVVTSGDGSALMKNPDLAARVSEAAVEAVDVPVTVKMRIGWDSDSINVVDFAKRIESTGVAAIAVHGRTKEQMYSGHADWSYIKAVKEAVSVPVLGNGDIVKPEDAKQMLDETGCDAVMVGRGAQGNPWI